MARIHVVRSGKDIYVIWDIDPVKIAQAIVKDDDFRKGDVIHIKPVIGSEDGKIILTGQVISLSSLELKYILESLKAKIKAFKNDKLKNEAFKGNTLNWNNRHIMEYIDKKFKQTYNNASLEIEGMVKELTAFNSNSIGQIQSRIKQNLTHIFENNPKLGIDKIKDYIDWLYDVKSREVDFPIQLSFIFNKALITEWMVKSDNGRNVIRK